MRKNEGLAPRFRPQTGKASLLNVSKLGEKAFTG
jgi:hypothetical protein